MFLPGSSGWLARSHDQRKTSRNARVVIDDGLQRPVAVLRIEITDSALLRAEMLMLLAGQSIFVPTRPPPQFPFLGVREMLHHIPNTLFWK